VVAALPAVAAVEAAKAKAAAPNAASTTSSHIDAREFI
jgi:hypothetical protein